MFDPFRPDLLAGKTTIITGGGTGLGRSMALRFAGLGAKVAVLGRRPEPLDETVDGDSRRGRIGPGRALRRPRSRAGAGGRSTRSRRSWGRSTSSSTTRPATSCAATEDLSPNAFNAVVQIVLYGTFHCTTELGRRLIARGEGGEVLAITTTYADDRLGLRHPVLRGQGRSPRPDQGARGGVGDLRDPPQRDRPGALPDRRGLQPADARLGHGEAGPGPGFPRGASASTGS